MIDLSFLTEAEQEAILKVLHRDTELKKAEEQRVRQLKEKLNDDNELKYKSGQWFYDAKSKRHRDKIHGADLVRASIRKRKKPATIELHSVMDAPDETEEDLAPSKEESNQSAKKASFPFQDKNIKQNGTASPAKQRKNPFNAKDSVEEIDVDNEMPNQVPSQVNGQEEKQSDIMSSIFKYGVKLPYPAPIGGTETSSEAEDPLHEAKDPSSNQPPVPKPRKLVINGEPLSRSNSSLQREDSFNGANKRRGILKRRSSSSSTDSESIRIPQSIEPIKLVSPTSPILEAEQAPLLDDQVTSLENSPDRQKQVRFSEKVLQKPPTPNPESYNTREVGEFGILDPSSYKNELDHDSLNKESEPTQYSYSDGDYDRSAEVLGHGSLEENLNISLTSQTPSNSAAILNSEQNAEDSSQRINGSRVSEILDESHPEISIDSAGTESLYAVVKKPSKSTSSDQDKDFDMDDALMEPKILGQRGKSEPTYQSEKSLEFGKSYGGAGKINYGSHYNTSQPGEVNASGKDTLAPERTMDVQSYHDFEDEPEPRTHDEDVLKWRRPQKLENEDLLAQPKTEQEFQSVNLRAGEDTFVKPYQENETKSKYSPGEYNVNTKYKSIFLRSPPEVEAPSSNFPVGQNMPLSSTPEREAFQTKETFLRNDRDGRDLPTSANFKVMPLKDRSHDTPREQMSNPSQFQSLKHFWNVEDKNRFKGDVDASPNRILTDVLKRNKPTRADLKQRNSKEIPADDFSLPSSYDSLSEEEQTSQKVASWLAQTSTVYGDEQVDTNEDEGHLGKEVMENRDDKLVDRKNQAEDFSSALQTQTEEALEAPKITDTEHQKSKDIQNSPFKEQKKSTTTTVVNSAEKSPASRFYGRVVQISSTQSPERETNIIADTPEMSSKPYPGEEVEESVERTVAPVKTASEYKTSLQKLLKEEDFISIKPDEHQVEESNLPNEKQQLIETEEIVEKSSVPKGNDHHEFISALNKLEMEACMPSILHDQDEQPQKASTPNTESPVKSSFKIGFEPLVPSADDTLELPQKSKVTYIVQSPPPCNEDVVETTTVPSRKDGNDLANALKKLEHEAAIDYTSSELEDGYEKPNVTPTLQTTSSTSTVQNFERPTFDVQSMPSPSQSVEKKSDLEDPCSNKTKKSTETEEAEDTYVIKAISEREKPKFTLEGYGKFPVEEEPIEGTITNTEEGSVNYQNRLMRLEEESAASVPVEQTEESIGENVSLAPTEEVFVPTKVSSSNESMQTELPSSKGIPEHVSQSQPYAYKELANYPQSPSDQSGSFTGSAGNVPCKKPDTSSANSKQGKPAPAGSPNDSSSSRHDKYTVEGMKAQEESISKVLDWFSRSSDSVHDQLPSSGLLEKSKTSPAQMVSCADKIEDEASGTGADDLVSRDTTSREIKCIPKMAEILESKEDLKTIDDDQLNILKTTPLSPIENEPVSPPQVPLTESLEFGKTASGCGKIKSRSTSDDSFQKYPQLPVEGVFKKESFEGEKEESSVSKEKASLDKDDTGETIMGETEEQTEALPPSLEQSEDQGSQKPENNKPILPQKRVSDIKLLWERDKPSLDATKKLVLSSIKRPFSPVELSVTPKSRSFDNDDQNSASLVTFRKVMVEDDEDATSPVDQLKSFWEKEKHKETGRMDRHTMKNDDKGTPMVDSRLKDKKRHTIHRFFDTERSTDLEKNLPARSVSLSESANETLRDQMKPTSFQSLKEFWNISSKSDDKLGNNGQPETMTKKFGSNPDLRSTEPFMSRTKSRLAAKSLQDIREDPSAVSQLKVYDAKPVSRKFSKEYSKKEDLQNSVNEIETEINPSNTSGINDKPKKPINSVDVTLQENSLPSNYLKSSSTVSEESETYQAPGISDEEQTGLTRVTEKSFAPIRIAKNETGLRLKSSQDVFDESVNLAKERPQFATFEICPDDQNEYRDEENGEMNEKGRKMLLVKQSAVDIGSPVLSNITESLQQNEKKPSKIEYLTGKDEVTDSRELFNENIEKTVVPCKSNLSDFDGKLQHLHNESLKMVDSQNENLTELEYMDINEADPNFSKVLAVSSGYIGKDIQSSGPSKGHQPIIINVSSKKTQVVNDLSEPPRISPTETSLISPIHSDDAPTVLVDLERQVDKIPSNSPDMTQEPTFELKASLPRETEVNNLLPEPNDCKNNAPQPEELGKQEIIERIENPIVLPRTRFNYFDEKLKQLYEEQQNSQPNLKEPADSGGDAENNEPIKNKVNVYLHSSEPKKTFLKSTTVNLKPSQTVSADRETPSPQASDVLLQEVNETVEKTVAPKRTSTAKSLEDLQKELLNEEEGFVGNISSGQVALNESHSKWRDQALRENSEDSVQEGTELSRDEHAEEAPKTRGTFMSHRQSTPVKDKNGSLQKSTLELYLEAPYRREISKSIDFEISGYVTSEGNKRMDDSHPVLSALKRSTAKTLNSKAVQEVSPTSTNQNKLNNQKEVTLAPTENSFPENAEKLKQMSQSVPSFLQEDTDGRETDSASESSFQIGRHKKSPSSLTNLSGSSGMASMSSVSGSVMSVYSGDFGNVDIKGSIEFAMDYVEQLKEFHIFIYQCKDLAAADVKKQRSDPYVKAYLLPEKAKMGKRKTAVKKKTLNPVYNEILRYKIPKQFLQSQTLNLSVWHHDALGRNSFLGEVNQNLATWDWNNTHRNWYQLEARTPASGVGLENRGEIKLSLKYIPVSAPEVGKKVNTTGEVHIWIKECIQLPMLRENKINSFVKCTILPDTSRKSRQKTRTVDKTPNPIFNHTMVYDGFKEEDLREACVELTVWDHNKLSNHFLGGLRIGLGTGKSYGTIVDWMDSSHEESIMWEKMISAPNTWIEGMLPLRMFKMAKLNK